MAKAIPGLRPWEVLSVEQAMDQITYSGKWYREPLGSFTTGPPYIQRWNEEVEVLLFAANFLNLDKVFVILFSSHYLQNNPVWLCCNVAYIQNNHAGNCCAHALIGAHMFVFLH